MFVLLYILGGDVSACRVWARGCVRRTKRREVLY